MCFLLFFIRLLTVLQKSFWIPLLLSQVKTSTHLYNSFCFFCCSINPLHSTKCNTFLFLTPNSFQCTFLYFDSSLLVFDLKLTYVVCQLYPVEKKRITFSFHWEEYGFVSLSLVSLTKKSVERYWHRLTFYFDSWKVLFRWKECVWSLTLLLGGRYRGHCVEGGGRGAPVQWGFTHSLRKTVPILYKFGVLRTRNLVRGWKTPINQVSADRFTLKDQDSIFWTASSHLPWFFWMNCSLPRTFYFETTRFVFT